MSHIGEGGTPSINPQSIGEIPSSSAPSQLERAKKSQGLVPKEKAEKELRAAQKNKPHIKAAAKHFECLPASLRKGMEEMANMLPSGFLP